MAWVEGEDQKTSSVGRSLARHKMKHPQQQQEPGGGKEMTISEKPGGGFHTHARMGAQDTEGKHADHATLEHAMEHAKGHFGHGAEKQEPKQMASEDEGHPMPEAGGLESMGVAGE
jgi:hypothetical protein